MGVREGMHVHEWASLQRYERGATGVWLVSRVRGRSGHEVGGRFVAVTQRVAPATARFGLLERAACFQVLPLIEIVDSRIDSYSLRVIRNYVTVCV
jgi:hypothetical protein